MAISLLAKRRKVIEREKKEAEENKAMNRDINKGKVLILFEKQKQFFLVEAKAFQVILQLAFVAASIFAMNYYRTSTKVENNVVS